MSLYQCLLILLCSLSFINSTHGHCPLNQVFSECGANGCENTCSNPTLSQVCKAPCKAGCICDPGYLRNSAGDCVLKQDCGDSCGPNELYSLCGNTECEPTCLKPNATHLYDKSLCRPGCVCQPGYFRNPSCICVLPVDCFECPSNEVWSLCPNNCPPETCDALGKSYKCPLFDYSICSPRCVCKNGYRRNKLDKCVPIPMCTCSDPNAQLLQNPTACPATCSDPNPSCPGSPSPTYACRCKPGFVLNNPGGSCVPYSQCPPTLSCQSTERYIFCPNKCTVERTCQDYFEGTTLNCSESTLPSICIPICICIPGLVRNSNGLCVPPSSCCIDPNAEVVSNPNPCPPTCAIPNPPIVCTRPQLPFDCRCKAGFALNSSGLCVRYVDCPPIINCDKDVEQYIYCPARCQIERSCQDYFNGNNPPCNNSNPAFPCIPKCRCNAGFFRNSNNLCVAPIECCSDPNAQVVPNPAPCQPTCADPNPTSCSQQQRLFGCVCKKGYILNNNGICIPYEQCPPTLQCKSNELFFFCPNPCPRERSCQDYFSGTDVSCVNPTGNVICKPVCKCGNGFVRNSLGICVRPIDCCSNNPNSEVVPNPPPCPPTCSNPNPTNCDKPQQPNGCKCKPGYILKNNGVCVPYIECPPTIQCNINEVFEFCPSPCPREISCTDYFSGNNGTCSISSNSTGCIPACKCKDGYVRNSNNVCVLPPSCCSAPNTEIQILPSPCPATCSNPNPAPCPGRVRPPFGCPCKVGYILNSSNVCVPYEECPPTINCKQNEVFIFCSKLCPREGTCEDYFNGNDLSCTNPSNSTCIQVCKCKTGFIRNSAGFCVLPNQCCSDENAQVIPNPSPCPATCSDPNPSCPNIPRQPFGCVCIPGYVLNQGICVKYEQCPPILTCKSNEIYKYCPKRCPREATCQDYFNGNNVTCTNPPPPDTCQPICKCANGFYRNSNNECVLPSKCCVDVNSELVSNPSLCPPTCSDPNPQNCPNGVRPSFGCKCKPGYILNSTACVPYIECPPTLSCQSTELFVFCPSPCPPELSCADYFLGISASNCLNSTSEPCKPVCKCKEGLVRKSKNLCVPPMNCCTDPNAEVVPNPPPCRPTCENPNPQGCSNQQQPFGCVCKDGYILNSNQICVPYSECPPTFPCGNNEKFKFCPRPCPREGTCVDYFNGNVLTCINPTNRGVCVSVCKCIDGFIRNSNNECVPPSLCCNDVNAEVVPNASQCRPTCANPSAQNCSLPTTTFGCQCKEGYLLSDSTKLCIPIEKCPPISTCGPNEKYYHCPKPCPREISCDEYLNGVTGVCQDLLNPKFCKPACKCEEGFVRNDKGICVRPPQCCSDPNAELVPNARNCQPTCKKPNNICTGNKPFACVCKPGYVLDEAKGICVQYEECPPIIVCNINEIYVFCPKPCPGDGTCLQYFSGKNPTCGNPGPLPGCNPACRCKPGFIRDANGVCVTPEDCCDSQPNSVVVPNPNPCPPTCSSPNPISCIKNISFAFGCACKPGFILNDAGLCVTYDECPPTLTCNKNEIYIFCPNPCPPEKKCRDYFSGSNPICTNPSINTCIPVCRCNDGYFRNKAGQCVLPNNCCLDPNAEVVPNPSPCQPQCSNYQPSCPTLPVPPFGCRCKLGYILNDLGQCVQCNQCPGNKNCKSNEIEIFYQNQCPREITCQDYFNGVSGSCTTSIGKCLAKCQCIEGFVRNSEGNCIRPELCCTDPNSELVQNPSPCPATCSNPASSCPDKKPAPYGCQCKQGYILNSTGKCVRYIECPPTINCKNNEEFIFCPSSCQQRSCNDYFNGISPTCPNPSISLPCVPVCNCKEGYVRKSDGTCVLPNLCCTDINAIVVPNPSQCPPTCSDPNPKPCPDKKVPPFGCQCRPGYILNAGICVPYSECPPILTCPSNTVYRVCPSPCPREGSCVDYFNGINIGNCTNPNGPIICKPVCQCSDGYLRNSNDECVLPENCCIDPNEEVVKKPNPCPATCSIPNPPPCPQNIPPFQGCQCKPGFIRNKQGVCVTFEECPPIKVCDANEIYIRCPKPCPREPTCKEHLSNYLLPCMSPIKIPVYNPTCRCKPGFYRNYEYNCVLPKNCKIYYY